MTVFLTDRNLGKRFPGILVEAGLIVEAHDDHFEQAAQDDEILELVADRGWVLLTADARMRYVPAEKQAVIRFRARVIHLKVSGRWKIDVLANTFAANIHRVELFLSKHQAPLFAVFRVRPNGKADIKRKF